MKNRSRFDGPRRCGRSLSLSLACVLGVIGWIATPSAFAQYSKPTPAEGKPTPDEGKTAPDEAKPTPGEGKTEQLEAAPNPSLPGMVAGAPGVAPWQKAPFPGLSLINFHGGLETDVGYAKYTYETASFKFEDFYDFRGRFVFGADLQHDFAGDHFFRVSGQLVAWIREQFNLYQGNVDDVFAQVGRKNVWDLMLGRFMTWRVYQKGLGFDIYTLEDTGALRKPTLDGALFGPHTYEVDDIFLRGTQGRAAFHYYPTLWSGIEVVGEYGRAGLANSLGGRVAGNVTYGPVSISAATEYKTRRPAEDTSSTAPDGVSRIECPKCDVAYQYGYGGGAVLALKSIELGLNAAQQKFTSYGQKEGELNNGGTGKRTSYGGYLQVDVGSFIMSRGLILGAGLNRTETLTQTNEFMRHVQMAGYIAFPLGFNDGMVKFVVSESNLLWDEPAGTEMFNVYNSRQVAGRLRVSFRY